MAKLPKHVREYRASSSEWVARLFLKASGASLLLALFLNWADIHGLAIYSATCAGVTFVVAMKAAMSAHDTRSGRG